MLTQIGQTYSTSIYPTQPLWSNAKTFTPSLGCMSCIDKGTCGGLSVETALYSCLHLCCNDPADCDVVCRNKPEDFADRVREIGGFALDNIPRSISPVMPELPLGVPIIFHGNKRSSSFQGPGTVCLPLYKLVDAKAGLVRYEDRQQLADRFGVKFGTQIILTGTATDPALERFWQLGGTRITVIRALKQLNIALVTTPNYSLFNDQPRWDDLYSIKRIGLVHEEFIGEGLPAALHVNARTERDWERWTEFIIGRPEISHLAFEFGTGGGWADRLGWHADQLCTLAHNVGRPLHLVVRGGTKVLSILAREFSLTCLETSTFVKTMQRKAAHMRSNGAIRWKHAPTERSERLDSLLEQNWNVISGTYSSLIPPEPKKARC